MSTFVESDHPRAPAGNSRGGEFTKSVNSAKNHNKIKVENTDAKEALKTFNESRQVSGPLSIEEVALASGALPGSKVRVSKAGHGSLRVEIEHPLYSADRVLKQDGSIYNAYFEATTKGRGIGLEAFKQQVDSASRLGFEKIETSAAGNKEDDFNGYYTWPRLGYDGQLRSRHKDGLELASAEGKSWVTGLETKVSDLMKTKGGREWWKENGDGFDATFNLTKGSQSRKVLATYVKEKRKQESGATTTTLSFGREVTGLSMGSNSRGVEQYQSDINRVAEAGLRDASRILAGIRARLRRALQQGHPPKAGAVRSILLHELVPSLARTMAVAKMIGMSRSKSDSDGESLQLDWFSEVMKEVRAAGVGTDLTKAQRGYARRVYDSMRHMGAGVDARTRAVIASLITDKTPLPKALKVLDKTLDQLGIGPISRGKLETIYRTESSAAYYAGRWEQDQKDPKVWGYRYLQIERATKRDEHVPLDGTTLPKNALFWRKYWPPNGWNCGCHIQTLYKKAKEVLPGKINGEVPKPDKGFKKNFGKDLGVVEFSLDGSKHPCDQAKAIHKKLFLPISTSISTTTGKSIPHKKKEA